MRLSVVVPLLNEQDNLRTLHERLSQCAAAIGCDAQFIFVDDGSADRSAEIIAELAKADPRVLGVRFSRNFGHEAASTAGFDLADGDAVVLMDADLQDPPELLQKMVDLWRGGNQIVYARRSRRQGGRANTLAFDGASRAAVRCPRNDSRSAPIALARHLCFA